MDRNIRRALYTALVVGGLMLVAASAAQAAGEGRPDPATQGATDTVEGDLPPFAGTSTRPPRWASRRPAPRATPACPRVPEPEAPLRT